MESQMNANGAAMPWRLIGWGGAVALILTPLLAMQFTSEVDWNWADFLVMGTLLGTVGMGFELAIRSSTDRFYRLGAGVALITAFLLIWANLAVGIIGSEDTPINLLFFAVVAIGIAGGFASRFTADGMARAMLAAAVVQGLVGALALLSGVTDGAFALAFALPMLLSALLFRRAADDRQAQP